MFTHKTLLTLSIATCCVLTPNVQASTALAFTDFNDSSADGQVRGNLNWQLNGLLDPGTMTNNRAALFTGNSDPLTDIVKNNFTPGFNTGNTDSLWFTSVPLTVAPGFSVTFEEVTFNAVSISGNQVLNVSRRNDYRVALLSPTGDQIQRIDATDIPSGTNANPQQPLVTFDFDDIVLGPGTYILSIAGGDPLGQGFNETGNHTGIDNLSINGTAVSVVPTPSAMTLGMIGLAGFIVRRRRR